MKKYILYCLILIIIFIIFSLFLVTQNVNNKFSKYIKDNFPVEIKLFIKNTIMYYPIQYRDLKFRASQYEKLFSDLENKKKENDILKNRLNAGKFQEVSTAEYNLKSLTIPYASSDLLENNKKSGYVDIYLDKLVIVSGNGKFLITDKKNFLVNKFLIRHLPTNIEDMNLFDNKIKWTGIKDIKIVKNDIYISLTEEIKKNCYGTSVFQANFNLNYLNFKNLYRPKECVNKNKKISSFKFFNGYQTGGRIEWFDNKIYLSTGDYNNWEFPQNNSGFGKIVEINAKNHSYKLIASGLRNPQGMEAYHSEKNYLIITDHGPKGGDEINIINLNDPIKSNNFGWPTASYGEHYDVVPINKYTKKFAPLHKSHTKHGFKEPLYWFKESIGISAVIKNFFSREPEFIITSLKDKSLYFFKLNVNNEIAMLKRIEIGERIRDIVYDNELNSYFLYLEDSPKIMMMVLR